MNIVFWIIVFVVAFLVWCCLANAFKFIGKWWKDMMENVKNNINDTEDHE